MTVSEIRALIEKCKQIHNVDIPIHFEFNGRFTSRGGDAKYYKLAQKGVVRLSRPLWPRMSQEQKENTIVHETCHIIAHHLKGYCQKHNHFWQAVMWKCGYKPSRCHNVDTTGLKRKVSRVVAYCGCGEHPITQNRRTRMLRGQRYRCCKCNQELHF